MALKISSRHLMCKEYLPNASKIIKTKLKEVQEELAKRKSEGISLWAAGEYMLDVEFCKREKKTIYLSLKDNYILDEMSCFNPL